MGKNIDIFFVFLCLFKDLTGDSARIKDMTGDSARKMLPSDGVEVPANMFWMPFPELAWSKKRTILRILWRRKDGSAKSFAKGISDFGSAGRLFLNYARQDANWTEQLDLCSHRLRKFDWSADNPPGRAHSILGPSPTLEFSRNAKHA